MLIFWLSFLALPTRLAHTFFGYKKNVRFSCISCGLPVRKATLSVLTYPEVIKHVNPIKPGAETMEPNVNIETIRQELEFYTGRFPTNAVRAAIEQRDAMIPVLLAALQEAADAPAEMARDPNRMLHMYAMYLLAQFCEQAAYPLLVKFFSTPGEISLNTTGDVVTEDLDRILASVCHNDLEPIKRMIEDAAVNEYVRSACLRTLVILVAQEKLSRKHVVDYFRSLFQDKLEREPDFIWGALVSASCDLYPEELLDDIQQAYDDGLVDLWHIRMDSVRDALAEGKEKVLRKFRQHQGHFVEDTVAEMHWWACFTEDANASTTEYPTTANQPLVKGKKIGRNDPCPCGSGKKYKKCCLH